MDRNGYYRVCGTHGFSGCLQPENLPHLTKVPYTTYLCPNICAETQMQAFCYDDQFAIIHEPSVYLGTKTSRSSLQPWESTDAYITSSSWQTWESLETWISRKTWLAWGLCEAWNSLFTLLTF
ncbi:hypothetical protein E2C01_045571 [Portunus trituberculatus]|uniref:Uncharacterized protein n=1 Tax=Portunus trituberculatus TaxID=210409 RepID=A0A5B7G2F4_PORTR|nr:hypothetical protein [Portunus trituberculatus]